MMVSPVLATMSVLIALSLSGCPLDSKEELVNSAHIPLAEAVRIAEASVPGTAVVAEITQKDGIPTYVVGVLDHRGTEYVAYVDARNGQTVAIEGG
ncbi:MAG: PepSY domain-containing protein [Nitrospiraceae bacterium]